MWKDKDFNDILEHIFSRQLGCAITAMENYFLTHPHLSEDALQAVKSDYALLQDYWKKGFDDPQRENLYVRLLHRVYMLAADTMLQKRINNTFALSTHYHLPRQQHQDWVTANIKEQLQTYVSDVAMLELEPEHTRRQKEERVYAEHQKYMSLLFDYILTSHQWSEAVAQAMEDILLSPTIDVFDQQLMVSAMTLAGMNVFDLMKFRVLVSVYEKSADDCLRQRALVGWVCSLDADNAWRVSEVVESVRRLCSDERCRKELVEMQIQMVYCMAADDDSRLIKDEIMPDLMKGNNIQMTRKGFVEMDEDQLENILHPDAAEQNMEKMEASMQKMADMQRRGADIYYAGFSQMKRFPFFNDLSNWFVPFYPKHPDINTIWSQSKGQKFLKAITSLGAFCDSDKYSFVLAFNQVLSHLPAAMLQMVENGEASPMAIGGEVPFEEQRQPAFLRRIYLQNLYRFFRLFPQRTEFCNPFDHSTAFFFANRVFKGTALERHAIEIAAFLSKKKLYKEAVNVLGNISEANQNAEYYLMMGHLTLRLHPDDALQAERSSACFSKALTLLKGGSDEEKSRSDAQLRERALKGYARTLFLTEHYDEALQTYRELMEIVPDNRKVQLNAAVCMVNLNQYDEALKLLFKLNYEDAHDHAVNRVLAWALTLSGKYGQAAKIYDQLLQLDPKDDAADLLNYGYCLWFQKDIMGAISLFRQYISAQGGKADVLKDDFLNSEHRLILEHGISELEIQLMLDTVCNS